MTVPNADLVFDPVTGMLRMQSGPVLRRYDQRKEKIRIVATRTDADGNKHDRVVFSGSIKAFQIWKEATSRRALDRKATTYRVTEYDAITFVPHERPDRPDESPRPIGVFGMQHFERPTPAPYGYATREPTHYYDDRDRRVYVRSGKRCTDGACQYCTPARKRAAAQIKRFAR